MQGQALEQDRTEGPGTAKGANDKGDPLQAPFL